MNFLKKIEKLKNAKDGRRELKPGEIKGILIKYMSASLPDFIYDQYKKGFYSFKRIRQYNNYNLYEVFYIGFSLKEKVFCCSVSSCLNKSHLQYDDISSGPVDVHYIDIKAIIYKRGALSIDKAYYFHNGKLDNTINVVKKIVNDLKKYGLRFLDKRYKKYPYINS
jgi:hypothetical protein